MIKYFVQHHNNFESKQPNQTIRRSRRNNGKTDEHFLSVLKLRVCLCIEECEYKILNNV